MNRERFISDLLEKTGVDKQDLQKKLNFNKKCFLLENEETPLCYVVTWIKEMFIDLNLESTLYDRVNTITIGRLNKAEKFDDILFKLLFEEENRYDKFCKLLTLRATSGTEFYRGGK